MHGERDILGLWAGGGGEGAKFWLAVLTELKNRGVADVCIAVCDGLRGLPDAITTVWELATVQARIIHLLRNTFRFASRRYWDQIAHDLRPVYTAASEAEALARFEEFEEKWAKPYPAIGRLWRNAWSEFVPFLDYGGCRRIQVADFDDRELRAAAALSSGGGDVGPARSTSLFRPWLRLGGSSSG